MNRTSKKRESRKKTSKAAASHEETGSGVAALKESASLAVERNSKGIAASLLEGALAGKVSSTKLLLSLAEGAVSIGKKESVEAKVSIASIWAAEPQWPGEMNERADGTGSREPES